MMRKLLLFFAMFCVSIGAWAAGTISTVDGVCTITLENPDDLRSLTYSETDLAATTLIVKCSNAFDMADMSKINQFTNATTIDMAGCYLTWGNVNSLSSSTVEYLLLPAYAGNDPWASISSNCPNVKGVMRSKCVWGGASATEAYTTVTSEGAFAAMSSLAAPHTETWNTTPTFVVSGPMNAADYAGLSAMNQITSLDMSGVTLASDVDALSLANTSVQYVRLPAGVEFSSITNPISGCTSLKAVLSSSTDGTKAYAHVTEGNRGALSTLTSNTSLNSGLSSMSDWTISGYLQNSDIRMNTGTSNTQINNTGSWVTDGEGIGALPPSVITSIDLTDAVFECGELTVNNINQNLASVKFPNNSLTCTSIPAYCAQTLTKLTSIEIPSIYTEIGAYAFQATGITRVKIGNQMENVGDYAFASCKKLGTVEFEKGLTSLEFGDMVFSQCADETNGTGLKHVIIPEGVTKLGATLFNQCTLLASVRLPSTLTEIGEGCFYETGITQLTIPENVDKIGKGAFFGTKITDIYVTNPNQAPQIYCDNKNSESFSGQSTFGSNHMINNTADAGGGTPGTISKTWDEAVEAWHAQNGIVVLHYPEGAEDIYDNTTITENYGYTTSDGFKMPCRNDNDYVDRYAAPYTDEDADKTEGFLTRKGWKQFALQKAYKPDEDEVLKKQYKDVWYTMCFPFHLTDEQLEEAFNAEYNICEFNSVEVATDTESGSKYIVLHFNTIAEEQKDVDGISGANYLATAYHPYMIHPNLGTSPSTPVDCYFTGVKRIAEVPVTSATAYCDGSVYNVKSKGVKQSATENGVTGTFYFIGNVDNPNEEVTEETVAYNGREVAETDQTGLTTIAAGSTRGAKLIPYGAYFLGTAAGATYPKYWRESSQDYSRTTGKWSQYAAIVLSDQQLEKELYGSANNAKSFEIDFSEYFSPDTDDSGNTTDLKGIIKEAESKNQPVQFVNIVYNINGQVVKTENGNLEGLPKGMYIVNGKKYLVK